MLSLSAPAPCTPVFPGVGTPSYITDVIPAPRAPDRARAGPGRDPDTPPLALGCGKARRCGAAGTHQIGAAGRAWHKCPPSSGRRAERGMSGGQGVRVRATPQVWPMQEIIIVAGPNGAGKTSFANEYLFAFRGRFVFINADEIAREIADPNVPQAQPDLRAAAKCSRASVIASMPEPISCSKQRWQR
jgi:hypothetical protein